MSQVTHACLMMPHGVSHVTPVSTSYCRQLHPHSCKRHHKRHMSQQLQCTCNITCVTCHNNPQATTTLCNIMQPPLHATARAKSARSGSTRTHEKFSADATPSTPSAWACVTRDTSIHVVPHVTPATHTRMLMSHMSHNPPFEFFMSHNPPFESMIYYMGNSLLIYLYNILNRSYGPITNQIKPNKRYMYICYVHIGYGPNPSLIIPTHLMTPNSN